MKLVVSLQEARDMLGDEAEAMDDDQIAQLIIDLDEIAKYALDQARKYLRQ